jgi:hypothetical protein
MKKKIFELLICMLLVATAVPSASMTTNWTEVQKLLSSDGTEGDLFGCSVSLNGDTALIGAYSDEYFSGSAYVFTHTNKSWIQQAKLTASDRTVLDAFGISVSLDGDTALIGAYQDENLSGSAYVFIRTGTSWTQQAKLLASDSEAGDCFGNSISLSGDTALIGSYNDDDKGVDSGSAYVFTRTGTSWTQQAKLTASDGVTLDAFGISVSLDGDTAIIGAHSTNDNKNKSGSAYVFTRTGTSWAQQTKLLASDAATNDYFGSAIALTADNALVGAPWDDNRKGSVYVFTRTGTSWTQQAKLTASDGTTLDSFGMSVSLDGNTALIGAEGDDDNKNESGSAYVFIRTGTTWTQQAKLHAPDYAALDFFGTSVCISGDTALIGAQNDDDNGQDSGSAYTFTTGDQNKSNEPPIINLTWTPSNPKPNQTIIFDASPSNDPDGVITLYEWDWNNDGIYEESHTNPTATHSWPQADNSSVTLRVTDNENTTITKTITVSVSSENGTNNKGTPGFELIFVIGAIAISIILWKKKRNP